MSKLFEHRLAQCQTWRAQRNFVENDPGFAVPVARYPQGDLAKFEFVHDCVTFDRIARWLLRDLYNNTSQLRMYVNKAASSNLLDHTLLRRLKSKMASLQVGFQEACGVLGHPREPLVWDTQPWWFVTQSSYILPPRA
jgi:hypothetical protein